MVSRISCQGLLRGDHVLYPYCSLGSVDLFILCLSDAKSNPEIDKAGELVSPETAGACSLCLEPYYTVNIPSFL
jgi:hypothetical protein